MAERRRPGPARRRWSEIERELRKERGPLIAGVDEVGRGPLAGPVVACAIIMPPGERAIRGVDDSKALSAAERARLAPIIRARALAVGVGAASVREIDRLNIYHASTLAMRRALARLSVSPDHVLIDGKSIRSLTIPHTAVVHGDARCFSIACASIIAKVTRDRLMRQLGEKYPTYRWGQNSGYATADHVAGLAAAGLTPTIDAASCEFASCRSISTRPSSRSRNSPPSSPPMRPETPPSHTDHCGATSSRHEPTIRHHSAWIRWPCLTSMVRGAS